MNAALDYGLPVIEMHLTTQIHNATTPLFIIRLYCVELLTDWRLFLLLRTIDIHFPTQ